MRHILDRLAKASAVVGGIVVVAITLVTTASIAGRSLLGKPLLGDTELVEYAMAVVVACYLPICQWRSANIIVDFFTTKASQQTQRFLDRAGSLLIAAMMALIAWRTVVGAIDQKQQGSVTMLLQWPEWYAYAMMAIPLALTAVIALYMGVTGRSGAHAAPPEFEPAPTHGQGG